MDINALKISLREIGCKKRGVDPEADHCNADKLLLEFINDPEVSRLFHDIEKWYA